MYRKSYFELQLFTLLTRNEAADSNTFFNKCPGYLFLSHLSIREYLRKLDSFFNHSLSVKFKYFDLKLGKNNLPPFLRLDFIYLQILNP